MTLSEQIENLATEKYGVTIRPKKEVWWQRWLAKLLFFNPRYLDDFSGAVGNQIHLTEHASWRTICHELQHIVDMRKMLFVFFLLFYYSPQVLALVAFGSFYSLWFLFALTCLLPLPAIGRMWLEARGYGVSLAVRYWAGYKGLDKKLEYYTETMSGPNYYFAMPIKPIARKMIEKEYKRTLERKTKLHQDFYRIITNDRSRR